MTTDAPPAEPLEATLKDGTRVRFRPIEPGDKKWLQLGMERMSPESRYRRFFSPVDRLTDEQLRYFTEVDQRDHVAWVATLPDEPEHPAIAVARFIRLPHDHEAAEAAVTVIDDYQGRGLGRALLRVLAEQAISHGIRRFNLYVLAENESMTGLLREAGAEVDDVHEGVYNMHVDLPETADRLDESAAPRILRVAASGQLQGQVMPALRGTRFLVGQS